VTTGVYFCRLQTQDETHVKKMIYSGGTFSLSAPSLTISPLKNEREQKKTATPITASTYKCQITNTNATSPKIIDKELNGIQVAQDTSLNVLVYANYFPIHLVNEWIYQTTYFDPWLGHDSTITDTVIITNVKRLNGREYYRFNDRFGFSFFGNDLFIAGLDTVYIRQNEKGDIVFLAADTEWVYLRFDAALKDSFVVTQVRNTKHSFDIASFNDTVNTPVGLFENCCDMWTEFPDWVDNDEFDYFAPGYGPVKFVYGESGGTIRLIGIKILN